MTTDATIDPGGEELADAFVRADEARENAGTELGAHFGFGRVEGLVDLRGLTWGSIQGRVYALGDARLVVVLDADPARNPNLEAFVGKGALAGYVCAIAATRTLYLFTTSKRDDGEVGHALRRWQGGAR